MKDAKAATDPGKKWTKNSGTHEVYATLYSSFFFRFFFLAHTGPEIAFAVGLVDNFMQSSQETHLKTARRIFGYVNGFCF